jgi:hypothetical protein
LEHIAKNHLHSYTDHVVAISENAMPLSKMKYIQSFVLFFLMELSVLGQHTNTKPEEKQSHISIEIPEVHELMFVIYALTEAGISDSMMINHNFDYYRKVMAHFSHHSHEKIVKKIGKMLPTHYNQLRMDAFNYHFDEQGNVIKTNEHAHASWGRHDFLKPYLRDLKKFSAQSGFRDFYKSNCDYYSSLTQLIAKHGALEQQTMWLESRFPIKHKHYTVVLSPLSYGMHATNYQLEDVVVFVSAPDENSQLTKTIFDAQVTRMLFTEIDHNFVNPISDEYKAEIKKAFCDRKKWTAGKFTDGYVDEYAVFNEYMTWASFILYVMDTYSGEDFQTIKTHIENTMMEYRGFIHFHWFVDRMIELYLKKEKTVFNFRSFSDVLPLQQCARE